jgi:hypothetical protein
MTRAFAPLLLPAKAAALFLSSITRSELADQGTEVIALRGPPPTGSTGPAGTASCAIP